MERNGRVLKIKQGGEKRGREEGGERGGLEQIVEEYWIDCSGGMTKKNEEKERRGEEKRWGDLGIGARQRCVRGQREGR